MSRRLFTLYLCMILSISLLISGCNKPSEIAPEPWQGVISLWEFPRWPDEKGDRFGWIEKKIEEFEKSHPGVFIHLRQLDWEYGMVELRAAVSAGVGPDIAPIGADFDFIYDGYLEPVDGHFTEEMQSKYHPKALEAVIYDGRFYGFPWFITTGGLFVNREAFDERGVSIPEDGQWSYDEFVSALQKLTFENSRGKVENYGFNLFLSPGNYSAWGMLTMDGARIFDENGNLTLNCPEGISALGKMSDLLHKYRVVPQDYGTLAEKEVWGDFAEKKRIAVYPAGPWAIKILKERLETGEGFEFDIMDYPRGSAPAVGYSQVCAYGIFKQSDPEKKEICEEFLEFITSEEEQEVLSEYGVFPAMLSPQQKVIEGDEHMMKMKELMEKSELIPKAKNLYKIEEIMATHIRNALLQEKTPEEALEDIAQELLSLNSSGL